MEYIAQTLPYEVFNEADKINKLFEMGLEVLHIRKPLFSKKDIKQIILGIKEEHHAKIVLHSNFGLLSSFNLKGIHIDITSLNNPFKKFYYNYLKNKYKITFSTTSSKVLKNKFSEEILDYVFIGPVFVKYSEENIVQKIDSFELKKDLQTTDKKIYATGCTSLKNIIDMDAIGFTGSVLQSYIWKSDDIFNAFKALKLNTEKSTTSSNKELAI